MEQQRLNDLVDLKDRINRALEKLDPDTEINGTLLSRYSRWDNISQVPDEKLKQLCLDLEAEIRVREILGDEKYFANLTLAERRGLYRRAESHMEKITEEVEYPPDRGITQAEFRRLWNKSVADCPATDPPKEKPKGRQKNPSKRRAQSKKFQKPTVEDVAAYCREKGHNVDPVAFVKYYGSIGWKVGGKTPMVSWKNAVCTWARRESAPPGGGAADSGHVGRGNNVQPTGKAPAGDILADAPYLRLAGAETDTSLEDEKDGLEKMAT